MSPLRSFRARRALARVREGIDRCSALARDSRRWGDRDPATSGWSVGEHVEHLDLVDRGILDWIGGAPDDPEARPGGGPSPVGRIVLLTGRIPRGRGRAPEGTAPVGTAASELESRLAELEALAVELEGKIGAIAACRATLPHPVLGHFDPPRWLRFLHIHHAHHERIIADISPAGSRTGRG